ncbi:hypothetical protein [Streptomyces sp. PA03-2a]|uniref:hypothetical protein n=1 Tax=Streptomyces sp. PA03-2a TaxID=3028701 RepID=UPI0029BA6C91|nr:hypothetical protein [Streptomyces sp. PA03-2a]MDX2732835.1 hypothetical protein [Streptomyces sp. PA03-2a]
MSTPDALINGGLVFGPGLALAAGVLTARTCCRWATDRWHDRLDTRRYKATAARLHRVADIADAVMAMPEDLLTAQLEAKYAADNAREEKK